MKATIIPAINAITSSELIFNYSPFKSVEACEMHLTPHGASQTQIYTPKAHVSTPKVQNRAFLAHLLRFHELPSTHLHY